MTLPEIGLLVGTWRLLRCEARAKGVGDGVGAQTQTQAADVARNVDTDSVTYPYGHAPKGFLTYTPEARMAVSIMRDGPARVESDDVISGTSVALAEGTHAFIGYCGTVRVDDVRSEGQTTVGWVVHTLDVCSFPNWVGSEQRRQFRLEGERLTLTTPPLRRNGVLGTAVLEWERYQSAQSG